MSLQPSKLANYQSERGANAYLHDHETKLHRQVSDRAERRILRSFFAEVGPLESILDLPSGYGRLLGLLREHAPRIVEADVSATMLKLNAERHGEDAAEYLECSGLAIPVEDRHFDGVVSVRLNHHLESESAREAHLRELCRVARRAVVVTFFSHRSLKNLLRRLRAPFNKKKPKNTMRPERVVEVFAECGFEVRRLAPLSRIGSGHVYGLFVRKS